MSCAVTAEPIEMPFGGLKQFDPRNHVIDGGPDPLQKGALLRRTLATVRGDMTVMRTFAKLLCTLVVGGAS